MQKINLYSRDLLWWERLKSSVKNIVGRTQGGPKAAVDSLVRGLTELGQPFTLNEPVKEFAPIAIALTGANVLQWALRQKQQGKIGLLLAGPDVGMPNENSGAMFSPLINGVLLPALWVVDFCEVYHPGFRDKAFVMPAGVETLPPEAITGLKKGILVYQKNGPQEVFDAVIKSLNRRKIPCNVLYYGRHSRSQYFNMLRQSQAMVYLSQSESQGLVLNEAWMFNVPTLVYSGSYMKGRGYEYAASSPAPYLTSQTGMFFSGAADFLPRLDEFLSGINRFTPRLYHEQNFTDKICAQKLINILTILSNNEHQKYS